MTEQPFSRWLRSSQHERKHVFMYSVYKVGSNKTLVTFFSGLQAYKKMLWQIKFIFYWKIPLQKQRTNITIIIIIIILILQVGGNMIEAWGMIDWLHFQLAC